MQRLRSRLFLGLLLVTLSTGTVIFHVDAAKASGTICIRTDGSIEPPTAPVTTTDRVTYIITADINEGIVIERNNIILDGLGHTVKGNGGGSGIGIELTSTRNITVTNMEIRRFWRGIVSELGCSSSDNTIINSNIAENGDVGIALYSSTNYEIRGNNISASTVNDGICICDCSEVKIVANNISTNKRAGVVLAIGSENNLLSDNDITGNGIGILFDSGPNKLIHNNFVGNTIQTNRLYSTSYANVWDDDYLSGGNYWSNYRSFDVRSGPYQNATGSDGIGDTPIILDWKNRDHYPLMKLWPHLFGDVNSDGKVDMRDVCSVARRSVSVPGDPLWNAIADIEVDGKIDMKDIGTVARHFGEHCL